MKGAEIMTDLILILAIFSSFLGMFLTLDVIAFIAMLFLRGTHTIVLLLAIPILYWVGYKSFYWVIGFLYVEKQED